MKVVSIDIEATGVDIEYCQILEIGAVIFDTNGGLDQFDKCPKFKCIIDNGKEIKGQPYAIDMNARIFKILAGLEQFHGNSEETKNLRSLYRTEHVIITPSQFPDIFWQWLHINGLSGIPLGGGNISKIVKEPIYINVCGKNFSEFDKPFMLKEIPNLETRVRFRRRVLDPVTLFIDSTDEDPPGLGECMKRAGLEGSVTHDALQDSIDTAKVLLVGLQKLKSSKDKVNEIIKIIKISYVDDSKGLPAMLLGDVADLLEEVTGIKFDIDKILKT
jgi:DNA polymerase III epsilon subunit-like protein